MVLGLVVLGLVVPGLVVLGLVVLGLVVLGLVVLGLVILHISYHNTVIANLNCLYFVSEIKAVETKKQLN